MSPLPAILVCLAALGFTIGTAARAIQMARGNLRLRREILHWEHENERLRAKARYDAKYYLPGGPYGRTVMEDELAGQKARNESMRRRLDRLGSNLMSLDPDEVFVGDDPRDMEPSSSYPGKVIRGEFVTVWLPFILLATGFIWSTIQVLP